MTSEARHLTIVPDDPEAREARGPLRLFEELVRLASGETHLTVLNEDLAAALRVEVRTVQRWKQALRLATPPVVEIRRGNHYVIHMTIEGAAKVLSGSPRATVTPGDQGDIRTITPVSPHVTPLADRPYFPTTITPDHPTITPVTPDAATHLPYARAGAGDPPTTTTTTTTTAHDSHPGSSQERITPVPPTTITPDQLTAAALVRTAGIEPTDEVMQAMQALPRPLQVEVLDYVRANARRPNPAYLLAVAENTLAQLRAADFGAWDEVRLEWLGVEAPVEVDACDEQSRREPSPSCEASTAQLSTGQEGESPSAVRGATPRARSTTPTSTGPRRPALHLVGRALVSLGRWLQAVAR